MAVSVPMTGISGGKRPASPVTDRARRPAPEPEADDHVEDGLVEGVRRDDPERDLPHVARQKGQ